MNHNALDYLVTDFLEMHFSQERGVLSRVKKKLFSKQAKVEELRSSPCLVLKHVIVVIQDGIAQTPAELLLLNAKEHSFQTFILSSKPDGF